MLIYIIGPDGVGKSIQAKLLEKELRIRGIPASYVWIRWNHKLSLLPLALARLLGLSRVKQLRSGKKVVYHYFNRVKPIAVAYQYALVVDTALSILFKIKTRLWSGRSVICDRSAYDTLVDLMVSTRNPNLLNSYVARLLLQPSRGGTAVMLMARPDILKSRREDIREDKDLELKTKLYNRLVPSFRVTVLNAEEPIAKIHSTLMQIVGGMINEPSQLSG